MTDNRDMTAKNRILDRYEILTPLVPGREVYLVMDQESGEILVEKITRVCDPALYQRVKDYDLSGVPRIRDMEERGDKMVLVEDYVHGRNLRQWVEEEGVFSEEEVLDYMVCICQILGQFHQMNPPVIHRDIKPENIILTYEGSIYLIDYNISREFKPLSTLDTVAMVSHHFSAPELYGFGQSDQRSDIYSIGATMHFLLTGGCLKETSYHGPLARLIETCTMMDPNQRFQSVEELRLALESFRESEAGREDERKKGLGQLHPDSDKKDKSDVTKSFMIPGFRSRNPLKMINALIGYFFISLLCFSMEIRNASGSLLTGPELWIERISTWIFFILTIFLICNYRGCQDRIPLLRRIKPLFLRIAICIVIMAFLTLFLIAVLLTLLSMMKGS